mgnify:CR=1 FL=1
MKKYFLGTVLMAVLSAGLFFQINAVNASDTGLEAPHSAHYEQGITEEAEEALYCEVICPDGRKVKCWLCNCNKLRCPGEDPGPATPGGNTSDH